MMLEPKEAANLFINIVYRRIYQNFSRDMETTLLPEGLGEGADDPATLSEWFNNLDESNQRYLKEIVQFTIKCTIQNFLIILDNKIGYPISGQISEFALYLETYQDLKSASKNLPKEAIGINRSNTPEYEELESIFLGFFHGDDDFSSSTAT